jgi:hypothetical protein
MKIFNTIQLLLLVNKRMTHKIHAHFLQVWIQILFTLICTTVNLSFRCKINGALKKYRNSNSNSSTPQEFNLHLEQRSGSARPSASPAQRPRPAHFQLAASSVVGPPVTSTPLASPAAGEQSSPHRRLLPTPQTGGWSVAPSPAAFLGDLNAGGGSPPDGSPAESTGAVDMRQEFRYCSCILVVSYARLSFTILHAYGARYYLNARVMLFLCYML